MWLGKPSFQLFDKDFPHFSTPEASYTVALLKSHHHSITDISLFKQTHKSSGEFLRFSLVSMTADTLVGLLIHIFPRHDLQMGC